MSQLAVDGFRAEREAILTVAKFRNIGCCRLS